MLHQYEQFAELINGGMTTREAASEMGIDCIRANGLRTHAVRRGIITRKSKPLYVRAAEMHQDGATVGQIQSKLGRSHEQVRRMLSYARGAGILGKFESKAKSRRDGVQIGNTYNEYSNLSKEVRKWFLKQMQDGDTLASAAFDLVVEAYYRENGNG